jgi:hypothetical protein
MYAALALAATVMGYVGYVKHQAHSARQEAIAAAAERDQAKANLKIVEDTNRENVQTIERLKNEKQLVDDTTERLKQAQKRDKQTIDRLASAILEGSEVPENKVELSPVLRSTVRDIQNDREKRQGGAK